MPTDRGRADGVVQVLLVRAPQAACVRCTNGEQRATREQRVDHEPTVVAAVELDPRCRRRRMHRESIEHLPQQTHDMARLALHAPARVAVALARSPLGARPVHLPADVDGCSRRRHRQCARHEQTLSVPRSCAHAADIAGPMPVAEGQAAPVDGHEDASLRGALPNARSIACRRQLLRRHMLALEQPVRAFACTRLLEHPRDRSCGSLRQRCRDVDKAPCSAGVSQRARTKQRTRPRSRRCVVHAPATNGDRRKFPRGDHL